MATAPPDEINPFRAPTAAIGAPTLGAISADAESIRLAHLKHEASVKSVGMLAYGVAALFLFCVAVSIAMVAGLWPGMDEGGNVLAMRLGMALSAGFYLLGAGLFAATGVGLRRLQTWARWLALVLAVLLAGLILLGLASATLLIGPTALAAALFLAVPLLLLGMTIHAMAAPKANVVFSAEYRAIIRQTPHLRYRSGLVVRIAFGLLVGVIACFVLAGLVGGFR